MTAHTASLAQRNTRKIYIKQQSADVAIMS